MNIKELRKKSHKINEEQVRMSEYAAYDLHTEGYLP